MSNSGVLLLPQQPPGAIIIATSQAEQVAGKEMGLCATRLCPGFTEQEEVAQNPPCHTPQGWPSLPLTAHQDVVRVWGGLHVGSKFM